MTHSELLLEFSGVREFANFHESLVNPERTAHTGLSKGVDI
jgi:hypothetical protein